jgi:hypothetical protein
MDYQCDWYAPVLAEPNSNSDITTSKTLSITAGGVQGLGYIPLLANGVSVLDTLVQQPPTPLFR